MIRRLLREQLSALTLRTITFAASLMFLAACDIGEKSLRGQITLTVIGRSESICLVSEDEPPIGEPLANATVTAIDTTGSRDDVIVVTDEFGEALIELPMGNYDVRIDADEYVPTVIEGNTVIARDKTSLGDVGLARIEPDYFPNGVASGDVNQSSVVLWARAESPGTITFEYGQDPNFSTPPEGVRNKVVVDAMIPAKVDDISGLGAGTQYFYRACRGDKCQPSVLPGCEARGNFRTPHGLVSQHGLTFGVSSCFSAHLRPFVSIRNVPDRDLDFFVALGDTVYADNNIGAGLSLAKSLEDYRIQNEHGYSQRASSDDNYFARARASTAFYVNIDDHEILNNIAGGATPRSQLASGQCTVFNECICDPDDDSDNCDRPFVNDTDMFEYGLKAWKEYNPVREETYGNTGDPRTSGEDKLYRYRTFGKDAALFMLDARSFRDKPIELPLVGDLITFEPQTYDKGRTMLGAAQLGDLLEDLKKAQADGITWKFVLVPEPIQNLGNVLAADRFEGYAFERAVILHHIETFCISNVVFISGDIHGTITNNLIYRTHLTGLNRYSGTWDISAGPVAYDPPFGPQFIEKLVEKDPTKDEEDLKEFLLLDPESQNDEVKGKLNTALTLNGAPTIGLGGEFIHTNYLQLQNAYPIPHATRLEGRFDVTNVYGWTEFDIDAATQKLTVTTYGMNYYTADDPVDSYSGRKPSVVGKFEIPAVVQGADGAACVFDKGCSSCRCSLLDGIGEEGLGQCKAREGEGSPCVGDGECISGRCTTIGPGFAECRDKAPNGGDCRNNIDCESGDCAALLCRPSPNDSNCGDDRMSSCFCTSDNQCASGRCTSLGPGVAECRAKAPNGAFCLQDTDCTSNRCSLTEGCKAREPKGSSCASDGECLSYSCTVKSIIPPVVTCD